MAANAHHPQWTGRLVRLLLVFRTLVLLIAILLIPREQRTGMVAVLVLVAAVMTYVPLRRWEQIARSVTRHPLYLTLELLFALAVLATTGAHGPLFYYTLGTAALAGAIYGRRGVLPFSLVLIGIYEIVALKGLPNMHPLHGVQNLVWIPALYPMAIGAGVAAQQLIMRGAQTEALLRERTETLSAEQERLRVARELHDSLAKTVEGLAMTASTLPKRCERDPAAAARLAQTLADDARQAALEARALMSGLRPAGIAELPLPDALRRRAGGLAERFGVQVDVDIAEGVPDLPAAATHELLRILAEAFANAVSHGQASRIELGLRQDGAGVRMTVTDNGSGMRRPTDPATLQAAGHYGVAGMHERARTLGGHLAISSKAGRGTTVDVRIPLDAGASRTAMPVRAPRRRWPRLRRPPRPEVERTEVAA